MKICEKCSSESEFLARSETCSEPDAFCPWDAVTQEPEPLLDDPVVYEISIDHGNATNRATLGAISELVGKNYLEAKKIIEEPGSEVFSGNASEIVEKKTILDNAGVAYSISPYFPH